MDNRETVEPQYQNCLELRDDIGLARFGLMSNQAWHDDPKRLTFTFSRYKFVAKMLSGMNKVLEIGCADAFATRIVQQEVGEVTAVDFDPVFIEEAKERCTGRWALDLRVHNMLDGSIAEDFDAAFSLDVLEHIAPGDEDKFMANIVRSMSAQGVAVIGMPSIESQAHASPQSSAGHVNCKTGEELRTTLQRHFHDVFTFSMNDEVVHTGFFPMAQYLLAVCSNPIANR